MLDVADVADVFLLLQILDRDAAIFLRLAESAVILTPQGTIVTDVFESLEHPSATAAVLAVPVAVN